MPWMQGAEPRRFFCALLFSLGAVASLAGASSGIVVDWVNEADGVTDTGTVDLNDCGAIDGMNNYYGIEDAENGYGILVNPDDGEGSGKTLIISAGAGTVGSIAANSKGSDACTIDIGNLYVAEPFFTVQLQGDEFVFATQGNDDTIGLGAAGGATIPDYVRFDPNGARLTWRVMGSNAVVFGTG
jgi:hypothetical protein